MTRYIVVTCSSFNAAQAAAAEDEEGESLLEIASYDDQPLLFDNLHDAEDYMDVQDVSIEMMVTEAPESLVGIIVT